jgi:hypothetical protein
MDVLDVQTLRAYCLTCRKIVDSKHTCQTYRQVLLDAVLAGIAGKLYDLGLDPIMLTFYFSENQPNTYRLQITLTLAVSLSCEILGPLPTGWVYKWDGNVASSIEFNDCRCVSNKNDAEARLKTVVKEFETFLDGRDAGSITAMMLLTS